MISHYEFVHSEEVKIDIKKKSKVEVEHIGSGKEVLDELISMLVKRPVIMSDG